MEKKKFLLIVGLVIILGFIAFPAFQSVAEPLHSPPPSPPPPPTGPRPPPLPTFNRTELLKNPTPDLTRLPTVPIVVETLPPAPKPLAPALTWSKYNDRTGLSFEYPSNWFIVAPPNPGVGMVGWSISLGNINPRIVTKGPYDNPPDAFSIDIDVQPGRLSGYNSLDQYINAEFSLRQQIISREHLSPIEGNETVQVVYRSPLQVNMIYTLIYIRRGNNLYGIAVLTPQSTYLAVLKHVLDTLHLP